MKVTACEMPDGREAFERSWIVSPDGEVLGVTSRERPFVTVDVDLEAAKEARKTYPRYVLGPLELPPALSS